MSKQPGQLSPAGLGRGLGWLLLPLVLWSLYAGWGRWSDVQIDFGRELYVPWRLTQGEQLYRDIAYFNGPLSPYFNALVFKLFGVGYWTLVACNAALLLAFGVFLWRLLRRALPVAKDALVPAACLLFSCVAFFLGQQVLCGNYNFLSPYSHEATHGLMLGLVALGLAWSRSGSRRGDLVLGLTLGLVFLTKPELFVASALGVAALCLRQPARASMAQALPSLLGGLLLPSLVALMLLSSAMPIGQAVRGVLGGWPHLFAGEAASLPFYQNILGLDDPSGNALVLLRATGLLLGMWILGGLLAKWAPSSAWLAGAIFLASFMGWRAAALSPYAPAIWLAQGLPLLCLCLLLAGPLLRGHIERLGLSKPWSLFQALTLFGLLLLGKMLLQPRLAHYGFYLTLPATLALLCFGMGWLPVLLGVPRRHLLALLLGVYGAAASGMLRASHGYFEQKNQAIATGVDAIKTDFRGEEISQALTLLQERLDPDDELLVLPEGININYLVRRRTPSRFINFMPLELALFGEQTILSELQANPPKAVLLMHKDTSEYGVPFFGLDYGQAIYDWVAAHYEQVWVLSRGGSPLQPGTFFGVALFESKDP